MKSMSTMGKLMVACAVLSSAALVAAQGGGGGGGGRGQGRGGFGQGMFGGYDATGLRLLNRADVQRDLGVTDDQKTKLQALQPQRGGGGGGGFGGGGGGGGADAEARRAEMEKRNVETRAKIAEVLKPEQVTRLQEINVQLAKNRAILNADVQKTLGVTDDQKKKIEDLNRKMMEANMGLFQQMRDGSMTQDQLRESMVKNNETMNAELGKILTAEQAAKLKAMGGKEFKADPLPPPPF